MFGLTKKEKLWDAIVNGDIDKTRYLIEKKYVAPVWDDKEKSPLYEAMTKNHTHMADYLARVHLDIVWEAAQEAVINDNLPVLQYIIDKKLIGVNDRINENYESFLHLAVRHGSKEMVEYLVDKNADVFAVYKKVCHQPNGLILVRDDKPVDIAVRCQREEIVSYLETCMKSRSDDAALVAEKQGARPNRGKKMTDNDRLKKMVAKMSAEELGNALQCDKKMLQKMVITGMLAERLEHFPYDESLSVYQKVRPQVDEKNRDVLENIIRNKRENQMYI